MLLSCPLSVEADLRETAQLGERERSSRMELHRLQVALDREHLDRERAEEEAADAKDALVKVITL